jgi:hypothetical protein
MNWFTATTAKIFAALSVGLLIVLVIMFFQLWAKDGEIAGLRADVTAARTSLADCEAARRVQNAAIAAAGVEAERQRRAFADAVAAGNRLVRDAQGRVRIVRQSPRNGCPTPAVIRGADL